MAMRTRLLLCAGQGRLNGRKLPQRACNNPANVEVNMALILQDQFLRYERLFMCYTITTAKNHIVLIQNVFS